MSPRFLFAICQAGAESALKAEMQREWPDFRLAFSRPGFVTFRLPDEFEAKPALDLRTTFARTHGISLGKVQGDASDELVARFWDIAADVAADHLHVWERDVSLPGTRGFEPGTTPLATEVGERIAAQQSSAQPRTLRVNKLAKAGQTVLDCVLVEPNEWWIGMHEASSPPSRWPGGVCRIATECEPISRAYYKMEEALRWSQLPVRRGDHCAEIGTSPGGAAQALLERGLSVVGIDPAQVDERLLAYKGFSHVRKRAADMRRREFSDVRWLFVDANVAPTTALQEVEDLVRHDAVNIRGMLLTLKLLESDFSEKVPEYLERIRSWGYEYVRARQLAHNRREFCVAALRKRTMRRPSRRRTTSTTT